MLICVYFMGAERQHNLDLNLWISPPSGGQKGSDNVRSLHLHDAAYRLPDGKRTKVYGSSIKSLSLNTLAG